MDEIRSISCFFSVSKTQNTEIPNVLVVVVDAKFVYEWSIHKTHKIVDIFACVLCVSVYIYLFVSKHHAKSCISMQKHPN